jgi:hypothetical protein
VHLRRDDADHCGAGIFDAEVAERSSMNLRPRFHLSTLIAASFVAGVLIWANTMKRETLFVQQGMLREGREYGWPVTAQTFSALALLDSGYPQRSYDGKDEILELLFTWERELFARGICIDATVFMLAIGMTFFGLEKFANRKQSLNSEGVVDFACTRRSIGLRRFVSRPVRNPLRGSIARVMYDPRVETQAFQP